MNGRPAEAKAQQQYVGKAAALLLLLMSLQASLATPRVGPYTPGGAALQIAAARE